MSTSLNFILFQVSWFACVLGGAQGAPWVGPLVVAGVAAYHVAHAPNAFAELNVLAIAAGIGGVFDSALAATGWVSYPSGQWHPLLAPYWIVALWVAFATTLNVSMSWLKQRYGLAVTLGALGGPIAYLGGSKLGGIVLNNPTMALIFLALGWAIITPALVFIATHFDGARSDATPGALATAPE